MLYFMKRCLSGILYAIMMISMTAHAETYRMPDENAEQGTVATINDYLRSIQSYIDSNNYPAAIELFRKCEMLDPDNDALHQSFASVLNAYAVQLASQGKYDTALSVIEEAYTITPVSPITDNYRAILRGKAQQLYQSKEWLQAINIHKFIMSRPDIFGTVDVWAYLNDIADLYVLWGIEYLSINDISSAEEKFQFALMKIPHHTKALFYLGNIAFNKHQLPKAKIYWDELAKTGESDELFQQLYDRLNREYAIYDSLDAKNSDIFAIHHDNTIPEKRLREITSYLKKAYDTIGAKFSYYPESTVVIILTEPDSFFISTDVPHFAGGLYDGKIHIPVDNKNLLPGGAESLEHVIFHEYTHLVVHRISEHNVPLWLNEGIAEYFSREKPEYAYLKKALLKNSYFPFHALNNAIRNPSNIEKILLAYEESCFIVAFIIDKYGLDKLHRILALFGEQLSNDEVFKSVLSMSFAEFEDAWKDYAVKTLLTSSEQKLLRYQSSSRR
ncbi:MAG: hypothetical protein C4541_04110 [Candidatus Auribacter fodinae]|uniref:Peptidase MA-like domain-containing protein n=1 Tax=Candidatus Auribacter fodinae TaxID=2093366 RepID=A0A3A4R2T1_9BACT|nr:MAG: hypothetical protein C4541_04110 [Candidatus Auribacter fodinae]